MAKSKIQISSASIRKISNGFIVEYSWNEGKGKNKEYKSDCYYARDEKGAMDFMTENGVEFKKSDSGNMAVHEITGA